jgi:NAD(P)-dependent dehydrogenase (short-subunit alcohol dehydrogenase family)
MSKPAVEALARAAAVEPAIAVRVNAVSSGWVAETLHAMGRDPAAVFPPPESPGSFSGSFATAPPARSRRRRELRAFQLNNRRDDFSRTATMACDGATTTSDDNCFPKSGGCGIVSFVNKSPGKQYNIV